MLKAQIFSVYFVGKFYAGPRASVFLNCFHFCLFFVLSRKNFAFANKPINGYTTTATKRKQKKLWLSKTRLRCPQYPLHTPCTHNNRTITQNMLHACERARKDVWCWVYDYYYDLMSGARTRIRNNIHTFKKISCISILRMVKLFERTKRKFRVARSFKEDDSQPANWCASAYFYMPVCVSECITMKRINLTRYNH